MLVDPVGDGDGAEQAGLPAAEAPGRAIDDQPSHRVPGFVPRRAQKRGLRPEMPDGGALQGLPRPDDGDTGPPRVEHLGRIPIEDVRPGGA